MASFNGFTDAQMDRISQKLGYTGPKHKFGEFLASNPAANRAYSGLLNKVNMKFNRGGVVNMFAGGAPTASDYSAFAQSLKGLSPAEQAKKISETTAELKGMGIEVDPSFKSQYVDPVVQSTVNQQVGLPPVDQKVTKTSTTGPRPVDNETVTGTYTAGGRPAPVTPAPVTPAEPVTPTAFKPEDYDAYMQNVLAIVNSGALTGEQAFANVAKEVERLRGQGYEISDAELARSINAQFNTTLTQDDITNYMAGTPTSGDTAVETGSADVGAGTGTEGAGVDTGTGTDATGSTGTTAGMSITNEMIQRAMQPGLPVGGKTVAEGIGFDQATQQIGTGTGQVGVAPTVAQPATATTAQAATPSQLTAQQYDAALATGQMPPTAPAVGTVSAPMMAQTQVPSSTEVAQQQAAQIDQAVRVEAPAARQLSAQELVEAPADAQAAAAFAEQVQAAQAQPTPEATVQGQLANMMAQFEDGQTPPWAAGAMRNATAIMAQRGLGASSMAGQAIIQAAMESALPIATQDAQTMAQFEMQNLSNRQARAMLAAQQRAQFIGQEFDQEFQARVQNASRVADIANLNFSAEQQIALENAQLAQTVDLNNLSNRQAVQMANIAQIANLETTNLNNRQQAAVQNAQNFLQMDMANLSNEQQAVMFDAQSKLQTLLSDQAAENASRQFNASSQNQVDQFFANLSSQVSQFNATQSNAMNQFNIEQDVAVDQFNAELKNQRDQFNAQNQLIIAQSNAQWRRDSATADTAALNQANQLNAQAILGISEQAYANLWQAYEDEMEYAWQGGQNELDRINKLAQQRLLADAELTAAEAAADATTSSALGSFAATALFGTAGSGFKGFLS